MINIRINEKIFDKKLVISDFNLAIYKHEITSIIGASGAGKTTLLRIIAGLDKDYKGRVIISEKIENKNISYMFQENRLLEWETVSGNLKLVSSDEDKINEYLKFLEIDSVKNDKVSKLSGGMKRRVALARALVFDSEILFLDEPFKGLDLKIKNKIMDRIIEEKENRAILIVTHDIDEIVYLSDKVVTCQRPLKVKEIINIIERESKSYMDTIRDRIKSNIISD